VDEKRRHHALVCLKRVQPGAQDAEYHRQLQVLVAGYQALLASTKKQPEWVVQLVHHYLCSV
jgi:hypothetical protein